MKNHLPLNWFCMYTFFSFFFFHYICASREWERTRLLDVVTILIWTYKQLHAIGFNAIAKSFSMWYSLWLFEGCAFIFPCWQCCCCLCCCRHRCFFRYISFASIQFGLFCLNRRRSFKSSPLSLLLFLSLPNVSCDDFYFGDTFLKHYVIIGSNK